MEEYKAQYFTAILTLSKQKQIVQHILHPEAHNSRVMQSSCSESCARNDQQVEKISD